MQIKDLFRPQNLKYKLRWIMLAISICVFIFSIFMLSKKLYGYYHDNKHYEQIRAQVVSVNPSDKSGKVSSNPAVYSDYQEVQELHLPYSMEAGNLLELVKDGILSDYSALKKQNNELIGWIRMPGFKKPLDYPVMQSKDNNFYLYNDFYKNISYAGSIFMDYRNASLQVDRHIILYGHAMLNQSMFGNLKEFPSRPEDHTKLTKPILT